MHPSLHAASLLAIVVLGTSCAGQPGADVPPPSAPQATSGVPRVLTVAVQREPTMLHPDLTTGLVGGGGVPSIYLMVHETLVVRDENFTWVPQLAAEQLSVERGTWQIGVDGSMRTTWRLRPGVRWHDGTPFTADDLRFAFQVYTDPAVPNRARPALALVSAVRAPDPLTLELEWAAPYAYADWGEGLIPLPRHLLTAAYEQGELLESRLLSTHFVGLGAYRVLAWEPGSTLVLERFEDYYRGSPPLDRILVRFVPDQNAIVAGLLAAAIDVAPGGVLGLAAALALREQWEGAGNHVQLVPTGSFRQLDVQHNAEFARPRHGTTERAVRQALYRAIDRSAITAALFAGMVPVADSLIPPNHAHRPYMESSLPDLSYDPARARQLLADAGWHLDTGGARIHVGTGEFLEIDLRVNPGAEGQQVQSIVAQNWAAVGVVPRLTVLSPAEASDREHRARMPGAIIFNHPAERYYVRQDLHSRHIPSAADRWAGGNRAGYRNRQVDALIDLLAVEIVPAGRLRLLGELQREVMQDVALMPLHWVVEPILWHQYVRGVRGSPAWNVYQWDRVPASRM